MNGNADTQIPKFEDLKRRRTSFQQKLLDQFWGCFRLKGEWPLTRSIYSEHGKAEVRQALSALTGNVVWEENDQRGKARLHMSLLGILLTSDEPKVQSLLESYLEFQRELFQKEPERDQITHQEIGKAFELSTEDTALLGKLIFFGQMYGGSGGHGDGTWNVTPMSEAEDFPKSGDLSSEVARWSLRHYRPDSTVFKDEARRQLSIPAYTVSEPWPPSHFEVLQPRRDELPHADPLKRRYQVFVSSTYSDLIEERKHAMQALLVTKCIPSGMELFPAANMEQWNLIKQVIDDCDYYVVVVAGKYGSIGPGGVSYTEMEFDYAVAAGKPILGFYHSDTGKLQGEKLEDSDERRLKLSNFVEKVKKRLCHHWSSSEGLASALKTAIIHAIETDPKPGWVRASSVPTWGMVESLEKRISELEGRKSNDGVENSIASADP